MDSRVQSISHHSMRWIQVVVTTALIVACPAYGWIQSARCALIQPPDIGSFIVSRCCLPSMQEPLRYLPKNHKTTRTTCSSGLAAVSYKRKRSGSDPASDSMETSRGRLDHIDKYDNESTIGSVGDNSNGDLHDDDDSVKFMDDDDNGSDGDPLESVVDFIEMVDQAPLGSLSQEEISLMREIMESMIYDDRFRRNQPHRTYRLDHVDNDNDNVVESEKSVPLLVDRLLQRILDEYDTSLLTLGIRDHAEYGNDEHDGTKLKMLQPTEQDFLLVLAAWEAAIGGDPQRRNTALLPAAVSRALELLQIMEQLYQEGVETVKPDLDVFAAIFRILAASRERGLGQKVLSILDRMQQPPYQVEPDADVYKSIIFTLARGREKGAAARAEEVLRTAVQLFPPGMDENGDLTGIPIDCFNVVLTAWAKSSVDYGPERAEKLIYYMEQLESSQGNPGLIKPSVQSFTSLLDAYAQQNQWESVSQAEHILNRLLDLYLAGEDDEYEPTIASWTIVLSAWTRLSKKGFRAAANRVDKLFKRMKSLHEQGRISYAPDAIVYVICMNAFAYNKGPDAPGRAQDFLSEMHKQFLDGDVSMKPTAKSIRIVVDAWIRSGLPEAMEQAEKCLDTYEDLLDSISSVREDGTTDIPDDVKDIFRSMLFGWTKYGDPAQAYNYLLDMVDRDMKPDSFCFDRIIESNTQMNDSDAMNRTIAVVALLEACSKRGEIKPNERLYTSFIRAMTKARVTNLAQKAYRIWNRMQQLFKAGNRGVEPTVFSYNAVLMACAETPYTENPHPIKALKVALTVFNELRDRQMEPDHVTFGNMLRCCRLLPEGEQRDNLAKSTFMLCCQHGFVNAFVLRDLQHAASPGLYQSLLNCPPGVVFSESDVATLPSSWRCRFEKRTKSSPSLMA